MTSPSRRRVRGSKERKIVGAEGDQLSKMTEGLERTAAVVRSTQPQYKETTEEE